MRGGSAAIPTRAFAEAEKVRFTEQVLREARTVRQRRRVRRDSTLSLGEGCTVPLGYLAGQIVTVATSLFDAAEPVIELDDKGIPLAAVDTIADGKKSPPRRRYVAMTSSLCKVAYKIRMGMLRGTTVPASVTIPTSG